MPAFGTPRSQQPEIHLGDTIDLRVYAFTDDEQPIATDDITSVGFTVQLPDATQQTISGTVESDGAGFLLWTDTSQTGVYPWIAQFIFDDGSKKSYRREFVVTDPFAVVPQTQRNKVAEEVWMRIEDCFDSELGGPWLRDQTLAYFDASKVERFIAEGLLFINSWPPLTNLSLADFTTPAPDPDPALPPDSTQNDPDQIIIVQGTLIAVIRHLMRSYVEQPLPTGANIVWQSRRDYLDRWNTIYQIEWDFFKEAVTLWKRNMLGYGRTSLLIHNKAGRLGYATSYRARNASRGYNY